MHDRKTYDRKEGPGCFSTFIAWALVILWACAIYYASSRTNSYFEAGQGLLAMARDFLAATLSSIMGRPVDPSLIGHFGEYFVFGILILNALRHHMSLGAAAFATLLIVAAYAASDEIHQIYVAGRSCDIHDWLVDMLATGIAVGIAAIFMPSGRERSRRPR